MIKKKLALLVLRILGWKITGDIPENTPKCVVMMAPHTSNIDFLYGWLGYCSLGYSSYFLIKKEAFNRFTGPILRAMGGIPVDRRHSSNIVHQLTEEFRKRNEIILTITPEGTRRLNRNWKRGFYFLAHSAGVPVVLGFLDYGRKEGGFGPAFYPSGDYDADLSIITEFYKNKRARFPEHFGLPGKSVLPAIAPEKKPE